MDNVFNVQTTSITRGTSTLIGVPLTTTFVSVLVWALIFVVRRVPVQAVAVRAAAARDARERAGGEIGRHPRRPGARDRLDPLRLRRRRRRGPVRPLVRRLQPGRLLHQHERDRPRHPPDRDARDRRDGERHRRGRPAATSSRSSTRSSTAGRSTASAAPSERSRRAPRTSCWRSCSLVTLSCARGPVGRRRDPVADGLANAAAPVRAAAVAPRPLPRDDGRERAGRQRRDGSDRLTLAVVPEARLERTEAGLVPAGHGWFVLNARDAGWLQGEGVSASCELEARRSSRRSASSSASSGRASRSACTKGRPTRSASSSSRARRC